jgi:hypothetical protein
MSIHYQVRDQKRRQFVRSFTKYEKAIAALYNQSDIVIRERDKKLELLKFNADHNPTALVFVASGGRGLCAGGIPSHCKLLTRNQ